MSIIILDMRWQTIISVVGVVLIGLLIAGLQLSPRVESITAVEGDMHGTQPIQISFSRPMDRTSTEAHLFIEPQNPGKVTWNENRQQALFTPDQPWTPGTEVTVTITAGAISNLKLPLFRSSSKNFSVSPYLLTYLWPADKTSNLYYINPVTGEGSSLTDEPNGVFDYTISHQDFDLVYSTAKPGTGSQIILLDRDQNRTSLLVDCIEAICRSPQLSPDDRYLAYELIPGSTNLQPGIKILDRKDQTAREIGENDHYRDNPRWSSAGWLSYYDHTAQQFVLWNAANNQEIKLDNQTGGPVSWSADGRYFIYTEIYNLSDLLAPRHLLQYDIKENQVTDLTETGYFEDHNPIYAPQQHTLAFTRKSLLPDEWTPGRQIYVLEEDQPGPTQLTEAIEFNHTSLRWHPSGQQIAYVRYSQTQLSEPPEIWLINRDGTGNMRLVINGFEPAWMP